MSYARAALLPLIAVALTLPACSSNPDKILANDARRKAIIDTLANNPAMRQEMIDRLIGPPTERAVVIERILKDDEAAGSLVARIIKEDRGKALLASQVAADSQAKTFIRMLMLTGVMGESMTQKQANAIGLGEAFAFGNQRRTMAELKRLGTLVDGLAKQLGRFPVCSDFGDVSSCLAKHLKSKGIEMPNPIDAWGHPFQYRTDREGSLYILVSYSTDGMYDGLGMTGPTDSFDCDIVFSNGDFIQWPGWIRKSDIH